MPRGKITKLTLDQGFGVIAGEMGELQFYRKELRGATFESLAVGQTVEYEEGRGPKGPRATIVKPV